MSKVKNFSINFNDKNFHISALWKRLHDTIW